MAAKMKYKTPKMFFWLCPRIQQMLHGAWKPTGQIYNADNTGF